jgi:hypothetical protein
MIDGDKRTLGERITRLETLAEQAPPMREKILAAIDSLRADLAPLKALPARVDKLENHARDVDRLKHKVLGAAGLATAVGLSGLAAWWRALAKGGP